MSDLSTLEKVKRAYNLASFLDNEDLKTNFLTLKEGDYAFELFKTAIEQEVERLMQSKDMIEQVSQAKQEIDSIVTSIKDLQSSLVDMVQKAMSVAASSQPQTLKRGRPRDVPLPPEVDQLYVEIPGGPDIQPIVF